MNRNNGDTGSSSVGGSSTGTGSSVFSRHGHHMHPMETTWLPLMYMFVARYPTVLTVISMVVDFFQCLAFALNPHNPGHYLTWSIIYCFQIPFWDESFNTFIPYSTFTILYFILVAVLWINVLIFALSFRYAQFIIANVMGVFRHVTNFLLSIFFIPSIQALLSMFVCEVNPRLSSQERNALNVNVSAYEEHILFFDDQSCGTTMANVGMGFSIATLIAWGAVSYMVLITSVPVDREDDSVRRRCNTYVDIFMYIYRVGLCFTFFLTQAFNCRGTGVLIVSIMSLLAAILYGFYLPYYAEWVNRLTVVVYAVISWSAMTIYIGYRVDTELYVNHNIIYVVLALGAFVSAVIAFVLSGVRYSAKTKHLFKMCGSKTFVTMPENPFAIAALQNNFDLLPFPRGLPTTDACFSPYHHVTLQVLEEGFREEAEVQAALLAGAQPGAAPQPASPMGEVAKAAAVPTRSTEQMLLEEAMRTQVVSPTIEVAWVPTDAEVASRFLVEWQSVTQTFPTPHMISFASRIFNRFMLLYPRRGILIVAYLSFLCDYANNFSRMNMCLDIIRSAICELDLSLTERFLLYYFSLHVKEALGIRNAIHQVIVSRARSMHQDVLLRTTLVWRNLLEENRASMSLYWFTNSLALSRYECFCTYVNSLNTVTDDEVFLRNAGLFMDGVYGFRHSGTLCQAVAETVSSIKMMRLQRTFQESARVAEVMDMVNAETEADAKVAAAVEEEHKQDEGNDVASLDQAASSRMSSSLASSSTRVSSVLTSEGRSSQSKVRNSKKITAQMVERIQASVSKSYEELCAHLHWDMFKVSSIFAVILMLAVVAANFAVILVRLAAWRRLEAIIRSINYCRGFINMMLAQMYRTTALLPLDSSVGLSKTQQANLLTNVTYFRSIIDAAEAAHNDVLFGNNRIQDGKLHARVTRISNFVRFYTSDDDYTESRVSYLTHIPVVLASARRIAATLETTPGYFEFLGTIDPNMMSKNILITVESTFSELSTFMETNIRSFSSMSIIIFCACIAGTLFLMCAVGYLLLWNYRRAASVIAKELTLFNIIPKESVKRLAAEAQQKLDTFTYLNERQNVVTAVVESFEEEQKQPISMTDMMLAFGPKTAAGPTDGAAATAAPTGAAAAPSSKLLSHIIQHGGVDVKEASSPSNRRASTSAVLSHKSPRTTPVPGATSPLEDVGSALSGPQGSGEPPAEPTLRSDDGEEGMEMSSRQPTLEYATPGVPEGSPMLPSLSSPPVMGEGSSHSEPEDSLTPPTEQTDELDDVDEGDYTDFGDKLLNVYRLSGVSDEKKRLTRRQRMSMLGTITAIPPGGYDDDGLLEMDGDGDGFLDDEDASDREGSVDSEDRTGGSPHKSGRGAAAAHRASQKLPSSICLALLPLVLTTCMIIAAFAVNAAAVYSANDISDSTTSATAGLDCAWQIGNTTFSFYFYAARFVASQSFSDYLNVRDTIITNGEVLDNCRSAINSTNFFEAQRLIVTISLVSMSLIAHNIVENMTGSQAAATSAFALVANETWTPLPMTAQLANSLEPYLTAQQLSEWAPYTNSTYDLALPVEERHELALQTFLGPFGLALLENMVNGYTELLTDLQGVLDDSVSSSYNSFKSMEVATLALLGVSILSCFLVIGVYRHHRRVVILSLVCISLLVVSMITGILSLTKAQTFRSQELDWSQSYNTLYSQLCQFPRTVAYAVSYPFIDNDNALLQLLDVTSAEYIISVDNAFLPQPSSINKNVYLSTFRNVLSSRNEFIHYAWMSIVCAVHGRGDVSIFATNPQISDVTWNMNMDEFYYNYRKMNPNEVYFTTFEDDITNSNPEAMMNLSQKTITSSLLSTLGVQAFGSQSVASGQLTQEYDAALQATQNQMLRLHWVSFGFCIAALIVFFGIVVILSLGSIRAFSRTRDERVIYSAAFGKDSNHVLLTIASVVVFVVVANLVCIGFSAKLTSVLHVEQRVLQEQWFLSNTVALCLSLSNWTTYYDYSVTRGRLVTMLDSIVTMHQDAYLTSQAAMGMRGNRNTILFGSTTPYANYDSTSASMLKVSSCTDPTNSVDGNQQPFLIQFGVIYDLIRGIVLLPKSVTIQPLVLKAALLDIMTRVGSLQYHFYSDPTKATAYVTKELNTCLAVALVMLILAALVSILSFFCCLNSITTKVTQQSIGSKLLLLGLPDDILNTVPEIKEFYDPEAGSSNDQLKRKLQQSERLLQNILPPSISRRLKNGERVIADSHLSVTAVFASLVGFDEYAHKFDAKQLVLFLNGLVVAFDHIVDLLDLEKVKTIGDIYFFCGGLTKKTERDHALRCMECSLFFFEALEDHNNRHNTPNMKLRVGMNTDPAVAGVIGNKKVAYDLWGDCVNTASRMYSTGVPGRIQVSDNTYAKISSYFHFEDCHVQAKGKGTLLTHLYVDRVKSTVYTDINWRVST